MPTTIQTPVARTTSSKAKIALISGILGWLLLPVLGSLMAVIFGHMARAEIKLAQNLEGDGMALAGLVLGYSSLVITVLSGLFLLLFMGGMLGFIALQ